MKKLLVLSMMILSAIGFSQKLTESQKFWTNLEKHCGKSYEGTVTQGGKEGDGFTGKKLVMQVCLANRTASGFRFMSEMINPEPGFYLKMKNRFCV